MTKSETTSEKLARVLKLVQQWRCEFDDDEIAPLENLAWAFPAEENDAALTAYEKEKAT